MIEMVLFVLFDMGELPTYKTKPDVKDCEYVLGRFCENMIKSDDYLFDRNFFIKELEGFCNEKLLHLEVSLVFDILYENNIIIRRESKFVFRAAYWIFYFAARRMYLDRDFFEYIISQNVYASFPEIIEFYTGIDRNRSDAIELLLAGIQETCEIVENKTGLDKEINPLHYARWSPSKESLEKMEEEICGNVIQSKLPDYIKDRYADNNYNQLRPYDQALQTILQEYSLAILMQKIKACSRALRNSDYVDPSLKRRLLSVILRGWMQVSNILFVLAPEMASKGSVAYYGFSFYLEGNFGDSVDERISKILQVNPSNIVMYFKNDLYSNKIGPLIYDAIDMEENALTKHKLILLLIYERPINWKTHVQKYISSLHKNSYYLCDLLIVLRGRYQYDFATSKEVSEMVGLLREGYSKHELGKNKSVQFKLNLPNRDVD